MQTLAEPMDATAPSGVSSSLSLKFALAGRVGSPDDATVPVSFSFPAIRVKPSFPFTLPFTGPLKRIRRLSPGKSDVISNWIVPVTFPRASAWVKPLTLPSTHTVPTSGTTSQVRGMSSSRVSTIQRAKIGWLGSPRSML
jgi:hypothetical protein